MAAPHVGTTPSQVHSLVICLNLAHDKLQRRQKPGTFCPSLQPGWIYTGAQFVEQMRGPWNPMKADPSFHKAQDCTADSVTTSPVWPEPPSTHPTTADLKAAIFRCGLPSWLSRARLVHRKPLKRVPAPRWALPFPCSGKDGCFPPNARCAFLHDSSATPPQAGGPAGALAGMQLVMAQSWHSFGVSGVRLVRPVTLCPQQMPGRR